MKHYIIRMCQALCLLAVIMGIGLGAVSLTRTTLAIGIPTESTEIADTTVSSHNGTSDMDNLSTEIQNIIGQYNLEVSVSAVNLQSGKQVDAGESAAFLGASTTKVLTAAYFMHQVEQGETSLHTMVDGEDAQTLIQRMLTQSDNTAWASLNDYLDKANLQTYASRIGLSSYDSTTNTITAHDQAQLLAKLQSNQLTNAAHTQTLLSYMQDTNNETLIPAALPADATVYHKYGELYGELHDSAIITYRGKSFVLVIFTKSATASMSDLVTRTQLFHDITSVFVQTLLDSTANS